MKKKEESSDHRPSVNVGSGHKKTSGRYLRAMRVDLVAFRLRKPRPVSHSRQLNIKKRFKAIKERTAQAYE